MNHRYQSCHKHFPLKYLFIYFIAVLRRTQEYLTKANMKEGGSLAVYRGENHDHPQIARNPSYTFTQSHHLLRSVNCDGALNALSHE